MSETLIYRRKIATAGVVLTGALALSGCSSEEPVDYIGTGNEFVIQGVVSDSEGDGLVQVKENQFIILEANGKAETFFRDPNDPGLFVGEIDFLQSYSQEPGGWLSCGDDIFVGEVYDETGAEISPTDLTPGDVIEINGKIRQSEYYQSAGKSGYCTEEDLAVYDTITIIDQPLRNSN